MNSKPANSPKGKRGFESPDYIKDDAPRRAQTAAAKKRGGGSGLAKTMDAGPTGRAFATGNNVTESNVGGKSAAL